MDAGAGEYLHAAAGLAIVCRAEKDVRREVDVRALDPRAAPLTGRSVGAPLHGRTAD